VSKTVLIVEDDSEIQASLREAFEDNGYTVVIASGGKEALDILTTGSPPHVIVLDLVMPGMTGNDLYAAMQADAVLAKIPVVVSTSDPSRAPSGVLVVPKPVRLDRPGRSRETVRPCSPEVAHP
jgi:CheY-like chemotaxis protein